MRFLTELKSNCAAPMRRPGCIPRKMADTYTTESEKMKMTDTYTDGSEETEITDAYIENPEETKTPDPFTGREVQEAAKEVRLLAQKLVDQFGQTQAFEILSVIAHGLLEGGSTVPRFILFTRQQS